MQGKNRLVWFIVVVLMFVAVLAYFFGQDKNYEWSERLRASEEQPYDLNIFYALLKENTRDASYTELNKKLQVEFEDLDQSKTYNLFAIRRDFSPDTTEIEALVDFIKKGNTLVLSAKRISPLLPIALAYGSDSIFHLYRAVSTEDIYAFVPDSVLAKYEVAETWSEKDSIHRNYQYTLEEKAWEASFIDSSSYSKSCALILQSTHQKISLHGVFRNDTILWQWNCIRLPESISGENLATYNNGKLAFTKFKLGKGWVILGAPPLLFSNYALLQKEHFNFCNALLSNVPKGEILVDNVQRFNSDLFTPKGRISQSPLTFILKQPALSWAWYTLLLSALLFVFFRSKRKQRIIPIIKPNLNTTLAYAKMLGSLQLKEKNNSAKANEIFQHFLQHLRSRNRWHSNDIGDELKTLLQKLTPELDREIQIVLYLGNKAQKQNALSDQEVVNLFNYTKKIIERI
jgi:hypothetical protein